MTNLILSAVLSSFCFVVFWVLVWRNWDKNQPEPFWSLIVAMILGLMAGILLLAVIKTKIIWTMIKDDYDSILFMICLISIEEILKFFGFLIGEKIYRHELNQTVDGFSYGAATGLGFAFIENIVYFVNYQMDLWLVVFRSLDTMFTHSLLTGIFAFYFMIAFNPLCIKDRKLPIAYKHEVTFFQYFLDFFKALKFHITFSHVLKHRKSQHQHRHTEVIFEGFWIVIIFHFMHNFFAEYMIFGKSLYFVVIFIIAIMVLFCLHAFDQEWYQKIAWKRTKS